ncbi:MAG: helix-turn-helix domain-containing protein [Gemmatimonadaceae bacterium]|nr:helix-turn-helix domain-containing protein [Gemmatimonadaceae bacterium]
MNDSKAHAWEPGFPLRHRVAIGGVLIGDWTCPKTVAGVGPEERARQHEIWLQRTSSHGLHVDGRRTVADPATAVFINAGDPVRPSYQAAERQRSTAVLIQADALRALLSELTADTVDDEVPRFPATTARVSAETSMLHNVLLRSGAQEGAPAPQAEETALAFVRSLLRDAFGRAVETSGNGIPGHQELTERVQHLLVREYRTRLTLSRIARTVGASPFHLTRVFGAQAGMPIHRYLVRVRLRVALELMQQRPRDLSWVALEAGFASHSHFTAAFRAEYGMAPSAWVTGRQTMSTA